jgi:agmatinase
MADVSPLLGEPPTGASFLGAPLCLDTSAAPRGFALFGAPYVTPYAAGADPPYAAGVVPGAPGSSASAPDAVRAASAVYLTELDHYDFDTGGALVEPGVPLPLVDCGDVRCPVQDPASGSAAITAVTRAAVAAGAVPLVVGGDHAVPFFVVRGLDDRLPVHVLQIDAHLDFRDEVGGVRDGYSSPMRRLRDLPWVETVVQVGLRDIGSARPAEVADALAAGNVLVRAEDVHEVGVDRIARLFPEGGRLYVTVDVDGLDPSYAPGVLWPAPGGLLFWQAARLLRMLARRCRLAGMDVCELVPARDPQALTALVVARLFMIAMGATLQP